MNSNSILKRVLPTTIGTEFEKNAESYLIKCGLSTNCRNYKCRAGEIDLVMHDADCVVFVEVRFRRNDDHGDPFESINLHKQRRLIRAATHFLAANPHLQNYACRFDAVGVYKRGGRIKYDWIKDAFST